MPYNKNLSRDAQMMPISGNLVDIFLTRWLGKRNNKERKMKPQNMIHRKHQKKRRIALKRVMNHLRKPRMAKVK